MNSSSSFDISSETLQKSFGEYNNSDDEFVTNDPVIIRTSDIKNPTQKTVNQLARLQAESRLSMKALQKIVPIINEIPDASINISNDSRFLKRNINKSFDYKFYAKCPKCDEIGEIGVCKKCTTIVQKTRDSFFIYIPIEIQIKKYLVEHFETIIQHLDQKRSDVFADVDDSKIQRKVVEKYPNERVLSLTLNIDGGLVTEKGGYSLWPIQLYQNYLQPQIRFLPENILVAGLFYGKHKPNPFELLFPLLEELCSLFETPIKMMRDGMQFNFFPALLFCSCDLPARNLVQNFKGPTGRNACPICLHSGHPNKEDRIRYRYSKEDIPSSMRKHIDTIKLARIENNNCGIKGMSCLMVLREFDIIESFATDYMHGVCLGVLKRMINIWFGKMTSKSIKFKPLNQHQQNQVNYRLSLLKPYSRITHQPRSLDQLATFKAIEFKYLLFFYLRYSLSGILGKKYTEHFELLSASIYLLSQRVVSENDIKLSEQMLNNFCDTFEKYYGIAAVTMNVHLLRHYSDIVRNTGPLWCHSLFGFESNMGVLTRYYLGGTNVLEQIADKYVIAKSQCEKLSSREHGMKCTINLHKKSKHDNLLIQQGLSTDGTINKSTHVSVRNEVFKSLESKATSCADFFLELKDGTIGVAQFYVIKNENFFVLLNIYDEVKKNYHLREVRATNNFMVFPFESIKEKLLFLTFGTIDVITAEPNKYEKS